MAAGRGENAECVFLNDIIITCPNKPAPWEGAGLFQLTQTSLNVPLEGSFLPSWKEKKPSSILSLTYYLTC